MDGVVENDRVHPPVNGVDPAPLELLYDTQPDPQEDESDLPAELQPQETT